jgi:activating signal cointegrator complex subunit 3
MKNYEALAGPLRKEFNEPQIEQIYKVITELPTVNIEMKIRGAYKDEDDISRIVEQPADRLKWLEIHADEEYTLVVNLHRLGVKKNDYIYCRFPKPKEEGWFLNLGEQENGELIALKRVPFKSSRNSQNLLFTAPSKLGRVIYTLYFISDGYIGLDQQFNIQLDVIEERKFKEIFVNSKDCME